MGFMSPPWNFKGTQSTVCCDGLDTQQLDDVKFDETRYLFRREGAQDLPFPRGGELKGSHIQLHHVPKQCISSIKPDSMFPTEHKVHKCVTLSF